MRVGFVASATFKVVGHFADDVLVKLTAVSILVGAALALSACGASSHAAAPPAASAPLVSSAPPASTIAPSPASTDPRGNDREAESNLRDAYTAAMTIYVDNEDFGAADAAGLAAVEPSLEFQTAASTTPKQISVVAAPQGQLWWATARSASGRCFGIEHSPRGTTFAGTMTVVADCKAPATDPHWTDASWVAGNA